MDQATSVSIPPVPATFDRLRTLLPIEWATLTRASVAHGLSQMPISFGPEPDRQARLALA